jgi:hypothetical protein|tara:strand:+ start:279 stop:659 length:381 start_codon:yes stop_codon:yes gene_type:complete
MAITYTWNNNHVEVTKTLQDINGIEQTNVVTGVRFELRGIHGSFIDPDTDELMFRTIGSVLYFDTTSMDLGEEFISYDDVTLSDIDSWVEARIGAEELVRMKLGIEAMIMEKVDGTKFWAVKEISE